MAMLRKSRQLSFRCMSTHPPSPYPGSGGVKLACYWQDELLKRKLAKGIVPQAAPDGPISRLETK